MKVKVFLEFNTSLFSVLSIDDLQKVTNWEDHSYLREYKIWTKHQSKFACSCSFGKSGTEDNKKGLLLRGYITFKIDMDYKMRCWRNSKEEQKGEEGKMDQFGIQQCEREEGDSSSSAFTLVLPKDNQGRSQHLCCLAQRESKWILV